MDESFCIPCEEAVDQSVEGYENRKRKRLDDDEFPGTIDDPLKEVRVEFRVKGLFYVTQRGKNISMWNGQRYVCPHGRKRSVCKDCGGSQICDHGRVRNKCKDCGGSQICDHGRQRSLCKECGGSSICIHGRQRKQCK